MILDIILTSHSKQQFSNILINLVKTKKISSQKKEQINNVLIIALKFKEVEAKALLEYLIGSYKLSYEQIDKILKFCLGCRPVINDFKYVKSILKRLFDTKDLTLTTEQINTISKHIIARFTCKKQNELSRMLIAYQQKLLNQQKSPKDFEISSDLKELIKDISAGLKQSSQNKSYSIFSKYKSENDDELNKLANESMSENDDEETIKAVKPGTKINTDLKYESVFRRFIRKRNERDVRKQEPIPKQKR